MVKNYKRGEGDWHCEHIIRNLRDQMKLGNGIAVSFLKYSIITQLG